MSQNTRHILTLARTTEKCSSPWLPGWQVRALSLSFWPRWQWKPRIAACIFCSVAVSPQACKMPLTICAHNAKAATQQQNLFHAQLKKPKIKPQKKKLSTRVLNLFMSAIILFILSLHTCTHCRFTLSASPFWFRSQNMFATHDVLPVFSISAASAVAVACGATGFLATAFKQ